MGFHQKVMAPIERQKRRDVFSIQWEIPIHMLISLFSWERERVHIVIKIFFIKTS